MDDNMPPRPVCEFDFNLPHGVDSEDPTASHNNDEPMEDAPQTIDDIDASLVDDQEHAQQPMNYDTFAPGFSDDEGGEATFDRTWAAQQARKVSPKNKKSPRRSETSDGGDEASTRTKRPRKSLFGGPVKEVDDGEIDGHCNSQNIDMDAPEAPTPDFRQRMSSLNLEQQDMEDPEVFQYAQDDRSFNLGFGLASFDRDNVSPTASQAPSEESFIVPPDDQPLYELRKNINRAKAFTYIDTDKTGNYDPSQEAKLKALRLQRVKAAKAAKKKGKGKQKVRKEHVPKCILVLRFKTFGNVRNYTNDEDNWPGNWSEVDTEYEEEAKDHREYYRRNTPDANIQLPIEDPNGLVDDITGYPSARGCKQCRADGKDCTMTEGGTFPCDECKDEDVLCEPIIKPVTKGRCTQCAHDDQDTCSFEDDPEQSICTQCTDGQFVCEALPPRHYKTPRISIDEILYGPNRKHIQCTFCRTEKKRCSLKKKTDKPPCKHCKKHGIGCTFYDIPKAVTERQTAAAKKKKAALGPTEGDAPEVSKPSSEFFSPEDLEDMFRADDAPISREATPELEMVDEAGNKGMLTKINTSFAHPVQFNFQVDNAGDCNFCEIPMFGFVGHFEKEVHVIKWHSGLGHTELGGGHVEDKGLTTMCTDCTMNRVQMILCEGHEFESLTDDSIIQDVDTIANELMDAEAGSAEMRHQLQRLCSMCFSIASWGCARNQPALSGETDEEERVGCGLRLCDKCLEILRDVYEWDLEEMAGAMATMPKSTEEDGNANALQGKPRADMGLLLKDGLLMRCMVAYIGGE